MVSSSYELTNSGFLAAQHVGGWPILKTEAVRRSHYCATSDFFLNLYYLSQQKSKAMSHLFKYIYNSKKIHNSLGEWVFPPLKYIFKKTF